MRILIRSLSGASPELGDYPATYQDGDLYVEIATIEELLRLRGICKHDIAVTADDTLLIVDDYYD